MASAHQETDPKERTISIPGEFFAYLDPDGSITAYRFLPSYITGPYDDVTGESVGTDAFWEKVGETISPDLSGEIEVPVIWEG